jgi:uncharacterized protein (TIGR00251 family)
VIHVVDHAEGCVVQVRAQPGAKRNAVVGEQNGSLKVAVTAPADQGKANKALVEALADAFDLKRSQVELISGPSQREKRFLIRGLSADELRRRMQILLNP